MANQVNPNQQVNTNDLTTTNYVPNNKLAIILDCQVGISAEECCEAIADIVMGSDMMFSSRLSGGRICVFLRTEEMVNKLVQEGGLVVRGYYIPIRRYVTQSTKIVLSNVSPIISNEILSTELAKFGKLASTIRNISNGYKRPDIAHIISFRRIVYMLFDKPDNIPETINIEHEGKNYLVFVSCEDILCYKCKGGGHIARNCKKIISQQPRLENTNNSNTTKSYADTVANTERSSNTFTPNFATPSTVVAEQEAQFTENSTTILPVQKSSRNFDSGIPSKPSAEVGARQESAELPLPKPKNKRKHNNNSDEAQEQTAKKLLEDNTISQTTSDTAIVDSDCESIKSIDSFDSSSSLKSNASESSKIRANKTKEKGNNLANKFIERIKTKPHYPLSRKKFGEFLKQSYGCKPQQMMAVIKDFTEDHVGLRTMIEENSHKASNFNLTRRLKRIVNVIKEEEEEAK
jgi:Zinc knuckle